MIRNPVPSGDALVTAESKCLHGRPGETPEAAVFERFRDLQSLVDGLLGSWVGTRLPLRPRKTHRVSGCYELAVTPLDDATWQVAGEARRVQAWDISPDGLSFMHRKALAVRTVAVTIPMPDGELESVVTELKWCRFARDHSYRSGGQFLRMQTFDWESTLDFSSLPQG